MYEWVEICEVSWILILNWIWKFQLSILKKKVLFLKKYFLGRTTKIHPKDGVSRLNFPEDFGIFIFYQINQSEPKWTFNKINTTFLLLSSWCNVCSMQTYLLQSSYPPNPDTAQAFCFSKEKSTIGSNFLLSHSSFYAPSYSTRFFFKLSVSQPLLYKVPSNSTGKNFVINVYCFYL